MPDIIGSSARGHAHSWISGGSRDTQHKPLRSQLLAPEPVEMAGDSALAPREPWRSALICACLALATLAVYWPVAFYPFTNFDDTTYVSDNPWVQQGLSWQGTRWAFTTFYFANWHPLNWLSHMADVQLFGAWAKESSLMGPKLINFQVAPTEAKVSRLTRAIDKP